MNDLELFLKFIAGGCVIFLAVMAMHLGARLDEATAQLRAYESADLCRGAKS